MQIVTVFLVSVMEYNFVNKSLGKADDVEVCHEDIENFIKAFIIYNLFFLKLFLLTRFAM